MNHTPDAFPTNGLNYLDALREFVDQGPFDDPPEEAGPHRAPQAVINEFFRRWIAGEIIAFGYLNEVPANGARTRVSGEFVKSLKCANAGDAVFEGPGQVWYSVQFFLATDLEAWRATQARRLAGLSLGDALREYGDRSAWEEFDALGGYAGPWVWIIGDELSTKDCNILRCKEILEDAWENLRSQVEGGELRLRGYAEPIQPSAEAEWLNPALISLYTPRNLYNDLADSTLVGDRSNSGKIAIATLAHIRVFPAEARNAETSESASLPDGPTPKLPLYNIIKIAMAEHQVSLSSFDERGFAAAFAKRLESREAKPHKLSSIERTLRSIRRELEAEQKAANTD